MILALLMYPVYSIFLHPAAGDARDVALVFPAVLVHGIV